jgi:hypothetical protein
MTIGPRWATSALLWTLALCFALAFTRIGDCSVPPWIFVECRNGVVSWSVMSPVELICAVHQADFDFGLNKMYMAEIIKRFRRGW